MNHSPRRGESEEENPGRLKPARSRRADQLLDVAMRLFAEQGYARTSVADIQRATGMTPGSGALYKHFPSKQALLEAGVERFIEEGTAAATELPDVADRDLEEVLQVLGERALHALEQNRSTMRVAWRDLPAFPELNRRFVDERLQFGFTQLAGWLADFEEAGRLEVEDPQATAAVLLGALAFHRVMDAMLGDTPGRVSDDRLLDAWVRLASRALTPRDDAAGNPRQR